MTHQESEIDEWELEAIQKRYETTHGFNLTPDQARQVYDYEQLRDTPSKSHYFSFWEEWDFELISFEKILTPKQFEDYKTNQQDAIRQHEQWLIEQDKDILNQIQATEDLLHYYETQLLPALTKQQMLVWGAFNDNKEKVVYLKAEYKKFLDSYKKALLVNHFRHSKTFQPNFLKLALLRYQLICLLPDYISFQSDMDTPTTAVADYLEVRMKRTAEVIDLGLDDILQGLKDFRKANTAKHMGEIRGWYITSHNEEDSTMFLLLLDKHKYGC